MRFVTSSIAKVMSAVTLPSTRVRHFFSIWHMALACFVSAATVLAAMLHPVFPAWAQTAPALTEKPAIERPRNPDRAAASERIVAFEARLTSDEGATKLVFRLSRAPNAEAFVMQGPDRVVIDLPEVNFQLPVSTGRKGEGLVSGYRYGLFASGRSRIVIDLAAPARVSSLSSLDSGNGVSMLEIELRRSDRADFAAKAREAAANLASAGAPPATVQGPVPEIATKLGKPRDKLPLIVLDPGHGGIDPGAITANVAEKAIVLAFGLKLRDLMAGSYRVVMTRDDDRFVALADRVKIARQHGAELFISLHADSLSQAQDVRGATIYTASERATDLESARLAARENQADALAGVETPREDREDVADILMDLAKRETRAFSAAIAARLVSEMGGSVKLHRIPQRSAGFRVLSAPDVPSVLIELGYVTSAKDIELLTSDQWRTTAAEAVKRAVDRFFEIRSGQPGQANARMKPAEAPLP